MTEEKSFVKRVGNRFWWQRKMMLLTQKEVAERAGMSAEQYRLIECGKRVANIEMFKNLCVILKLPADYALEINILRSGSTVPLRGALERIEKMWSDIWTRYWDGEFHEEMESSCHCEE